MSVAYSPLNRSAQAAMGSGVEGRVPTAPGSCPSGDAPDGSSSPSDCDPSRAALSRRIAELEATLKATETARLYWAEKADRHYRELRATEIRGGELRSGLRAALPETLNTGSLVNDVKMLRIAHDSMHRHAYRWGKAALLLLPFVDMAAGEGILWAEQEDGSPQMDAADLCVAFAEAMGCELGDDAYTAMMTEGEAAIRALASAGEAGTAETGTGSVHEYAAPSGETPSQSPDPLSQTVAPSPAPRGEETI